MARGLRALRWTSLLLAALLSGCGSPVEASDAEPNGSKGAGQDSLLGRRPPDWELGAWSGGGPHALDDFRGCAVLVRFWTNTCPYCRASLPAIEQLKQELAGRPVRFVGLYHAKPRSRDGDDAWQEAVGARESWELSFPIAHDRGWRTLDAWWLFAGGRRATSASFVLDHEGRIAFVHPGPVYFPSEDPADARAHSDYRQLRAALRAAVAAAPGC